MTSSLVGSEMCIRDRCRTLRHGPTRAGGRTIRPNGPESRTRRLDPTGAVSYTHLTLPTICSV
eukprot:12642813-Prorocentrum_lima.AAC.1